ncbi:MAG: amidohydrolase family protein [Chloroflexi bacterium]|nr:amidohydrolase family protein [Chloroflexota bacterium]MCL5074065.1 amidohydrolase family protein [Chloroflexota bacterium]
MIIDCYCHVWKASPQAPEVFMHKALTPEDVIAEMDRHRIDMQVLCPLGQDPDNDYIVECVQKYPNRFIGFMEVNPRDPKATQIIRHYAREYGMKGLKLHPTMMGHPIASHPLMDPIFEACSEVGIAIYGHCMHDFWVNPLSYEEMARTFPDVSVILGHMGILWSVAEAGMVAQRNPNVYLETSVVPLRSLRIGLQMAGAEKVVFGTDWPANDYDMQLEMIRRATRNEAEFKFVAGENLARLLKIS